MSAYVISGRHQTNSVLPDAWGCFSVFEYIYLFIGALLCVKLVLVSDRRFGREAGSWIDKELNAILGFGIRDVGASAVSLVGRKINALQEFDQPKGGKETCRLMVLR